ncbi:Sensor protein lytS [Fibrisoma limi BUZ 3]|uniref:Sensor protein lytS n=1 Tax=Fibrisoma limi BUZ 3 TaxID=1185876 RepID=I2GF21_9BACT|nr:histidine kinase [Fibrisoma limi]CCH52496.1 Sensor protein lytS [Fibrisoma limi BUZ 3]
MAALSLNTRIRRFLRPPRRYVYAAALIISTFRYVLILRFFPQFNGDERLFISVISFAFVIFMWESVNAFNEYLNRLLPFETGVLRRFFVQTGTCLIVLIALQTSLTSYFERYYSEYFPSQFANAIKVVSFGLNVFIVVSVNTAYFGFYFFEKWKKNLLEKEKWEKEKAVLQKQRLNAQYENLKNQLNPHFLFNSLSSLDGLIDEDPTLARKFLQQLSKVFRYVLQHKEKEQVPLETELSFIKNYVSLLKTRYDGALEVTFQIADDALEQAIVPVTLQVLIENAIKHNTINAANPLTISITAGNGCLTVANPVQRKRQVATSNGQGLNNLKMLYQYLSPVPVIITEKQQLFSVQIPLLTMDATRLSDVNAAKPTPTV